MEQERKVAVVGTGTFLDTAIKNLDEMKVAAQMILDSRLAPDHFYEKNDKGKPDYAKGNVASVILVCVHGDDLGLKPLVALQHIIPVNGLLSIKGDAAKTLIFKSGKLAPGTWKETITGSLSDESYECTITAKRSDTQETMSRTFGVDQAKRAGLWITQKMINGQDGWKYLKSAWYKYPERMIAYRVLGFLARDLFPDVLSGSYTTEEAMDLPQDTTVVVTTNQGTEVIIPDKDFSKNRSEDLTSKANSQIDKRAGDLEPPPPVEHDAMPDDSQAKKYPSTLGESYPVTQDDQPARESKGTMLNGTPGFVMVYSMEEMKEMDTADLNTIIECDGLMTKAREIDPGKNTNKKLRLIILSFYEGNVVGMIEKFDPTANPDLSDPSTVAKMPPIGEKIPEDPQQAEYESRTTDEIEVEPVGNQEPEPELDPLPPIEERVDTNKFNIDVPDLVDGKRGFDQVKTLFEEMANVAGVDNGVFDTMLKTKFPQFQEYRVKEDFCYKATTAEINTLLNSI